MNILTIEQGSPEWLAERAKYPTASEFGALVTPKELKPSKQIAGYVARKLAEKWMGQPMEAFIGAAADQGAIRQEAARDWYALDQGVDVQTVGLIVADDGKSAASPDGLIDFIGERYGLEIKCPEADTHVAWLLAGELPREHMLQVQGSMLVCGFDRWDFLSYYPEMPPLHLAVKRDPAVHAALREALAEFWERFDEGWARLVAANGGREPERRYDVHYEADGSRVETMKDRHPSQPTIGEILEGQA